MSWAISRYNRKILLTDDKKSHLSGSQKRGDHVSHNFSSLFFFLQILDAELIQGDRLLVKALNAIVAQNKTSWKNNMLREGDL